MTQKKLHLAYKEFTSSPLCKAFKNFKLLSIIALLPFLLAEGFNFAQAFTAESSMEIPAYIISTIITIYLSTLAYVALMGYGLNEDTAKPDFKKSFIWTKTHTAGLIALIKIVIATMVFSFAAILLTAAVFSGSMAISNDVLFTQLGGAIATVDWSEIFDRPEVAVSVFVGGVIGLFQMVAPVFYVTFVFFAVAMIFVATFMMRVGLIFPAVIAGNPVGIKTVWQATKGYTLRLTAINFIFGLLISVIFVVAGGIIGLLTYGLQDFILDENATMDMVFIIIVYTVIIVVSFWIYGAMALQYGRLYKAFFNTTDSDTPEFSAPKDYVAKPKRPSVVEVAQAEVEQLEKVEEKLAEKQDTDTIKAKTATKKTATKKTTTKKPATKKTVKKATAKKTATKKSPVKK